MTYVLFDIGGTKSRVALSDDLKTFTKTQTFSTPNTPEQFVKKITEFTEAQLGDHTVSGVAGGIRGVLNEEKTGLEHDAMLTAWIDFDLVSALETALGSPVILENDTALACLGEAVFGGLICLINVAQVKGMTFYICYISWQLI